MDRNLESIIERLSETFDEPLNYRTAVLAQYYVDGMVVTTESVKDKAQYEDVPIRAPEELSLSWQEAWGQIKDIDATILGYNFYYVLESISRAVALSTIAHYDKYVLKGALFLSMRSSININP